MFLIPRDKENMLYFGQTFMCLMQYIFQMSFAIKERGKYLIHQFILFMFSTIKKHTFQFNPLMYINGSGIKMIKKIQS